MEGPVEVILEDGTVARSERFMVALCTCRRSRAYPWCDTSHRSRRRPDTPPAADDQRRDHRATTAVSGDRSSAELPQDRNVQ
ncbi:CDGSH iron-sulfur domain-containing protein [Streptomyces sp. NPDC059371]|uniref:CDGSH iron-sulfur domain-containing protein n=1 Tax=Streptomyces sp. NPDC059371 TaxID=3346812 RepID=UPI003692E8EC